MIGKKKKPKGGIINSIIEKVIKKPSKKQAKFKIGRPLKVTEEVLQKLTEAFTWGFSDVEACVYANISERTLYNYCEKFPDFLQYKKALKNKPSIMAKTNLIKSIENGDVGHSKWWLERRNKSEFSLRVENTGEDGKDLNPVTKVVFEFKESKYSDLDENGEIIK